LFIGLYVVNADILPQPSDPPEDEVSVNWQRILFPGTAAIASNMAAGMDVPSSVKKACRYIEAAIKTAPGLGQGSGPLNHFHSTYILPFSPFV